MSEHQHYEFLAIDRPLDVQTQEELRAFSSRAEITAHRFVNTYNWGSFKGNAGAMMERWFDLFLHWANWGTRRLDVRLPLRYVDLEAMQAYRLKGIFEVRTVGEYAVLTIDRHNENSTAPEPYWISSAPFVVLRGEMLRGSLCALYLAWLLAVQDEIVPESTLEPPCPPDLARASAGLEAFAEYFELDRNLWAVAARNPDALSAAVPAATAEDLLSFMGALPEAEKTELLYRAVLEGDPHVRLAVERAWERATYGDRRSVAPNGASRRTAGELRAAARTYAVDWERAERERCLEEQRVTRDRRLAEILKEGEHAWRRVAELVSNRRAGDYEAATILLTDLKALADRAGTLADFHRTLGTLRRNWNRQPSLIRRLREAGL